MKKKFKHWLVFTEKGRNFDIWFKKNRKKLIGIGLGTFLFALVGIVCLIVWCVLVKADVWAWLTSGIGLTIFVGLIILILIVVPIYFAIKYLQE